MLEYYVKTGYYGFLPNPSQFKITATLQFGCL